MPSMGENYVLQCRPDKIWIYRGMVVWLVNCYVCVLFIRMWGFGGGSQKPTHQESHPAGNWTWKNMQVLRMKTIIILTTCDIINEKKVLTFTPAMMHLCAHMQLQWLQWHCWRIPSQYQCCSPNLRVAASSIFLDTITPLGVTYASHQHVLGFNEIFSRLSLVRGDW